MDWIAISAVALVVVTGAIYVFQRLRSSDVHLIKGLERQMNDLQTTVQDKLDKQDHQIALARLDRDMDQLRADQNNRLERFESKLDKLMDMVVEVIKK